MIARMREPALLFSPVAVSSLGLLLANDYVLKSAAAGTWAAVVTGKVSDLAGVVLAFALFAWMLRVVVGLRHDTCDALAAAVVACGVVYVKVWPFGAAAYQAASQALFDGVGWKAVATVVHDPTDAVALILLPGAMWLSAGLRPRASSRGARAACARS